MKILLQFAAVAAVIILGGGCTQVAAPIVEPDVITYSVDGNDKTLKADITYLDGEYHLISLRGQSLPWTLSIDLSSAYSNDVYLKSEVPQSEVFKYFLSGTSDEDLLKQLKDSSADFSASGVIAGDVVYSDYTNLESARVLAVEDENTLTLSDDILPNGNEPYYIYHLKNLTSTVKLNDMIVKEATSASEKSLSTLVKTPIAR